MELKHRLKPGLSTSEPGEMASNSYQMWLSQVTQPYTYGNDVASEVDYTLRTFHGLRPQSSIYTLSDGSRSQMLNLVGNISVVSQQNHGRVIEVPVEICLPLHYPSDLPLIWIRPDTAKANLVVRLTDNVDGNGLVWGLEGLRQLRLAELLSHLQNMFGYQLPIVSAEFAGSGNTNSGNNISSNSGSTYSSHTAQSAQQSYATAQKSYTSAQQSYTSAQPTPHYAQPDYTNLAHAQHNSSAPRQILKEKVVNFIEDQLKQFDAEMEAIFKTSSTLTEGEALLNRERLMLNNEINLLGKEINAVDGKRTELENLSVLNGDLEGIFNRSATTPSDPASSQLLELLANESALMDALYSLTKTTVTPPPGSNAKNTHLPLSTALRCIREISRKHFLTKAHIRKLSK